MIKTMWKDTIYGFRAMAKSQVSAWMLIRNKYHEKGLKPQQISQIEKVLK